VQSAGRSRRGRSRRRCGLRARRSCASPCPSGRRASARRASRPTWRRRGAARAPARPPRRRSRRPRRRLDAAGLGRSLVIVSVPLPCLEITFRLGAASIAAAPTLL
jgi:hypothetical protein